MKIIIEDSDMKAIHDVTSDFCGLDLTNDNIMELIKENLDLLADYIDYGIDTSFREHLGDILARKLAGRKWPENREGEEVAKEFHEKFVSGAKAAGYKVLQ